MNLRNARVWLTGASSGIGEAVVPVLLRRGARVAVSARRADRLEQLAAAWRQLGDVLVLPVDVTSREAVIAAGRRVIDTWNGIDLAIFNAGTHRPASGAGFDSAQFVELTTINYFGVLYGIEAVLPAMLAQGHGHIAGVASVAGYRALPTAAAYGASKAALNFALDALRFDLEPRGIRVTVVNPGFIKTPLTDKNRFHMPFLMPVDRAVEQLVRDLEREKKESHFPAAFTWIVKALRVLPYPIYERIIRRATAGQRATRPSTIGQ